MKTTVHTWKDLKEELFTIEEREALDINVAVMSSLIEARHNKHLSQRDLESLSGVQQPVIARMEKGKTDPRLSTLLKILGALGKTLAIVPRKVPHG